MQKGACFIYAHPVVVVSSPHNAEQCCYQSCYCQLVSSGCLYWSEMWCYWNPVVAPSRYMLNWLRPTGSWKSGGMKYGQRHVKKNNTEEDHMIICTFNYAQSSRGFFASVCIKLRRKTLWDYLRDGVRARQESAVDTQGQSVKSRLRGHLTPK